MMLSRLHRSEGTDSSQGNGENELSPQKSENLTIVISNFPEAVMPNPLSNSSSTQI